MKTILTSIFAAGLGMSIMTTDAAATVYTIDFEDGINQGSSTSLSGLDSYLQGVLGRSNVNGGDANWYGSSNTFGSDAIFSSGYSSTIDFDTDSYLTNSLAITSISFDWAVLDTTSNRDFGLDVYDDLTASWNYNIFEVFTSSATTGASGLIDLTSYGEVTRIRFHDSWTFDVGIDNLVVATNEVPEPGTLLLIGLGLMGLGVMSQQRKQAFSLK